MSFREMTTGGTSGLTFYMLIQEIIRTSGHLEAIYNKPTYITHFNIIHKQRMVQL